jgi:hypothetical protein
MMLMPSNDSWVYIFGIVAIVVIVFVLIREFVTWYFKLDKIVSLLETQNSLIEKLISEKSSSDKQV